MSEPDELGLAATATPERATQATDATLPAPKDSAITLAIGEAVGGRYRVHAFLGEGGMGAVYRATDEKLGEDVALKVVRGATLDDALRDEVRIAQRVTHPNVCRTYDLEEVGGHHFVKMEYVAGETLAARLRAGRLAISDAVRIARAIADGLDAAHAKGIVHRDLKPGNVMLDGDRVVLMDFGIARHVGSGEGEVAGTIGYMAPEQLAGDAVDARADLYALGCVLFEMLAGEQVFGRGKALEIATRHASSPVPDVRARRAEVPRWLARAVTGLLAKAPSARPPALARLRAGRRSPWRIVAPFGLAVVAAGAFIAWRVTRVPKWEPHVVDLPQFQENGDTPRFSPDGKQIAFVSDRGPQNEFRIYLMNTDGTNARPLTAGGAGDVPTWTRDGRSLLYSRGGILVRHHLDTGVIESLWPGIEPDDCGDAIVFVDSSMGPTRIMMRRLADGTESELVRSNGAFDLLKMPRCDASGDHVVFARGYMTASTANCDIALVDRAGHVTTLTSDRHAMRAPAFTPDGRSVVFASQRDGRRRLYEIALADRSIHPLTVADDWDSAPDVSADGRRVIFDRDTTSNNLWSGGDGRTPRRITSDRRATARPRPIQGTTIVLAEQPVADGAEIVAIDTRDGSQRSLARGFAPFPSKDGSLVYFRPEGSNALAVVPLTGGTAHEIAKLPQQLVFGLDGPDGIYASVLVDTQYRTFVVDQTGGVKALAEPGMIVPAPRGGRRLVAQIEASGIERVQAFEPGATTPSREVTAGTYAVSWLDDHRFAYCEADGCLIVDVTAEPGTPDVKLPALPGYLTPDAVVAPDGTRWYSTPPIGNVTRHILDNFSDRPWRIR